MSAKTLYAFTESVGNFIDYYGIENCGFLTLTFPDEIRDVRKASERFNSLRTGFLSKIMKAYIGVYERTKKGVIHFHFVMSFAFNIASEMRGGSVVVFDQSQIRKREYRSAPATLRRLWKQFRETLPRYGFGRHQLVPVGSGKGISRYLSKYLAKGIEGRLPCDKGFRLVRSTVGSGSVMWRVGSVFAWNSDGAKEWRAAMAFFIWERQEVIRTKIRLNHIRAGEKERDLLAMTEQNYSAVMSKYFGSSWCYHEKDRIWDLYQFYKERGYSFWVDYWEYFDDRREMGKILGQFQEAGILTIEYSV